MTQITVCVRFVHSLHVVRAFSRYTSFFLQFKDIQLTGISRLPVVCECMCSVLDGDVVGIGSEPSARSCLR